MTARGERSRTIFLFLYWYEPEAPTDPVGLIRFWNLARAWSNAGHAVVVFAPPYASVRRQRGFKVILIPLVPWRILRQISYAVGSMLAALILAAFARPSVVYYRLIESPHPLLVARLLRAWCLCEVDGDPIPAWWAEKRHRLRVFLRRWLARVTLRRADRVVVLTEGLREHVISEFAVTPERVVIAPSGTDTALFKPADRIECRRRLGLPLEADLIGFVGTFYLYQGLDALLEAFSGVQMRRPHARLLLVGDGEAREALKAQAVRLGIQDAIMWPGRVPYEEVPQWLGALDVCVAPFRADRGETSPLKVFDALACGCPVVATAVPSVARVFSEASGVVLVPPGKSKDLEVGIVRILENSDWGQELGRRGHGFVSERYGWAMLANEILGGLAPIRNNSLS